MPKFGDYSLVSGIDGSEELVVKKGVNTERANINQIKNFVASSIQQVLPAFGSVQSVNVPAVFNGDDGQIIEIYQVPQGYMCLPVRLFIIPTKFIPASNNQEAFRMGVFLYNSANQNEEIYINNNLELWRDDDLYNLEEGSEDLNLFLPIIQGSTIQDSSSIVYGTVAIDMMRRASYTYTYADVNGVKSTPFRLAKNGDKFVAVTGIKTPGYSWFSEFECIFSFHFELIQIPS